MVINELQNILSLPIDQLISENEKYNFSIHLLTSKDSRFKLLVTNGLSNNTQKVDRKNEMCKNIELYFCLPEYWNLENEDWPAFWLNKLAEIPQKNETWFGLGDTIPAGVDKKPLSDKFQANHFILGLPVYLENQLSSEAWKTNGIQLMAITPIFQTEVDFKLRNSATILYQKMDKKSVTELLDPYRSTVCRKRLMGLI